MTSDAEQENHLCLDCGIDISHRSRKALRCKPCVNNLTKERARDYYYGNRTRVLQHIKSRQQTPEYKQWRQEWEERNPKKILEYRRREKEKYRNKTGYDPDGRTCEECDADISSRGHNAERCVPCSTPVAKKCLVCDSEIRKRGPSRFCSKHCKQRHQQSKELRGYAKTCTKCSEAKEHSEFGLHYNRRRSVCKTCEVKGQTARYYNFTAEQRTKRNHRKLELGRIKRNNQSPEEREKEKITRRQAHRRTLYGRDFDENRLYAEQDGRCAICRSPRPLNELELDHDHETKRVRGFLCKNCNFKLLARYEKFPRQHPQHQDSPRLNAYLSRGVLQ